MSKIISVHLSTGSQPAVGIKYTAEASQTVADSAIEIIDFENLLHSNGITVTTGANWKATVQTDGQYLVIASITYSADANGYRYLAIYEDGVVERKLIRLPANASSPTSVAASTVLNLNANQYIDVRGFQNSGSTLNVHGSGETHIAIVRLGDKVV